MKITEQQIKDLLAVFKEAKAMNDYYTKQNRDNPTDTSKSMESHYSGKETGIGLVLDILKIGY